MQRDLLYVCRIKFKFGEYVGMSRLHEFNKAGVIAHLSLPMPNDWDHEDNRRLSLAECQEKFADRLSRYWRKRPAIIDSHRYDEDVELVATSPHPLRVFAEQARLKGCYVIPAIPLEPSGQVTIAVREIVSRNQFGAVLKLDATNLEDSRLRAKIDTVLGAIGLTANDAMLCIDLGDLYIENPRDLAEVIGAQITSIPYLEEWGNAYISVGAFSANLSKMGFKTSAEVARNDWLFYEALIQREDIPRRFLYSDFGVENPNFSRAPMKARASAHLRLTRSRNWTVSKGESIRKQGYKAIKSAADALVKLPDFKGPEYSFGNEYIKKIADGIVVGNPSYWRAAGVCHHITFVLESLRTLFGISQRRTNEPLPEFQDDFFDPPSR